MRPLPEHRPSWLSTILFALVVFAYFRALGFGFAETLLPWPEFDTDQVALDQAHALREMLVELLPVSIGLVCAGIAAWAWRSPLGHRFHIAFMAGLILLCLACLLSLWAIHNLQDRANFEEPGYYDIRGLWAVTTEPWLVLLTTVTGVVVIISAIAIDRRS